MNEENKTLVEVPAHEQVNFLKQVFGALLLFVVAFFIARWVLIFLGVQATFAAALLSIVISSGSIVTVYISRKRHKAK